MVLYLLMHHLNKLINWKKYVTYYIDVIMDINVKL